MTFKDLLLIGLDTLNHTEVEENVDQSLCQVVAARRVALKDVVDATVTEFCQGSNLVGQLRIPL